MELTLMTKLGKVLNSFTTEVIRSAQVALPVNLRMDDQNGDAIAVVPTQ
jgi:hypothetical protein